ncbi:hypothetical protein MTO96_046032 [Rhipicephalus appendiculatus]
MYTPRFRETVFSVSHGFRSENAGPKSPRACVAHASLTWICRPATASSSRRDSNVGAVASRSDACVHTRMSVIGGSFGLCPVARHNSVTVTLANFSAREYGTVETL